MERDGSKCRLCDSVEDVQVDHIDPWSNGGATVFDNLQVLCRTHNREKGDSVPFTVKTELDLSDAE